MRKELIEYSRYRPPLIALSAEAIPEGVPADAANNLLALTIDELLEQMKDSMPLEHSIVELKFFFGMTDEETAELLRLPLRTMQVRWQDARIWLFERAEAQQWRPANMGSGSMTT